MSAEEILKNLDEILKIPAAQQKPEVIQVLKNQRQIWGGIFFSKDKSKEDKIAVQDNLLKLHKYFGMKEIRLIGSGKPGGGAPFLATAEQRTKNCDDFITYLKKQPYWTEINPDAIVAALGRVWGPVK